MTAAYTPTTEEVIRSFSIPNHVMYPRGEDESFADYLSRISIEGHGSQIEDEAAARRWLTAHDAEVKAQTLREFASRDLPAVAEARRVLLEEADRIEEIVEVADPAQPTLIMRGVVAGGRFEPTSNWEQL